MLMRLFFILAAISIPVSVLVNQEAAGILTALLFMFIGAYFSKPRFKSQKDMNG